MIAPLVILLEELGTGTFMLHMNRKMIFNFEDNGNDRTLRLYCSTCLFYFLVCFIIDCLCSILLQWISENTNHVDAANSCETAIYLHWVNTIAIFLSSINIFLCFYSILNLLQYKAQEWLILCRCQFILCNGETAWKTRSALCQTSNRKRDRRGPIPLLLKSAGHLLWLDLHSKPQLMAESVRAHVYRFRLGLQC